MNNVVKEKQYISTRLGLPYDSLSQSYLRAETLLRTQSTIKFQVQANKTSAPIVTERLLQLNDQFVITHFAIALKQIGDAAPTDLEQLNAPLYTWENPTEFSGTNASNVASIYNASLNFTINRKEFVPQFPVRAFRRVPTSQQGVDLGYTSSGVNSFDGYDNGLYGFYVCEPTILDGRMTLDIDVELNASVAFEDSENSVYAVFEARGYLVVNAKN